MPEEKVTRVSRNKAIIEAMTDEELKEIKNMITAEQTKRLNKAINSLGNRK